jgi:hypothetical protein
MTPHLHQLQQLLCGEPQCLAAAAPASARRRQPVTPAPAAAAAAAATTSLCVDVHIIRLLILQAVGSAAA